MKKRKENSLRIPIRVCVCERERERERVCVHAQSCPTLSDLMDCSPPGSSVHGTFQARILEWVAISFSRIFPTKELNPSLLCLLHWEAGSLALRHLGSPHTAWVDLKASLSPLEAVQADSTAVPRLVRLAHGDRNLKGGPG